MTRGMVGGIIMAVVAYIVALPLTMPAAIAWDWLGRPNVPGELVEPHGTLVDGGAAAYQLRGQQRAHGIRWTWQASDLLSGGLGIVLKGRVGEGRLETRLRYGPFGSVRLRDLDANLVLPTVIRLLELPEYATLVAGQLSGTFPDMTVGAGGEIVGAHGTLTWREAVIKVGGSRTSLGDVSVQVRSRDNASGVRGELSSRDADLALSGEFTVSASGEMEGQVEAQDASEGGLDAAWLRATPLLKAEPIAFQGHILRGGFRWIDNAR